LQKHHFRRMKSILRTITLLAFTALFTFQSTAKEGMWLPFLIGQLNADEMTRMGMEITAEDIYSVNNSSLKDAIVHFGGGCTAELISSKGLLLTNHHCGYSRIQSHSSLENNYLKDGFWAMSAEEELRNPGLTADIVKYMEDVTNEVLKGISDDMDEEQRMASKKSNIDAILEDRKGEYELEVKPFFYGNQYILIAKEVFKDVRLVGAPPSSIGKYGADTDNWVWPRHTGDFSLFRVYAGTDNKPADISDENVPYQPVQHLKVNISGFEEGDFTMVYGFPGTTNSYLPSNEIENIIEIIDPARIQIREQILEILDRKMRVDEATKIRYASKYASISNGWKKWIGEVKGLKETGAVARKEALEEEFTMRIMDKPALKDDYSSLLPEMMKLYDERNELQLERYVYLESNYFGNELVRHLLGYRGLKQLYEEESEELAVEAAKMADAVGGFYEDFDPVLSRQVMKAVLPGYIASVKSEPVPELITELKGLSKEELNAYVDDMYDDLILVSEPDKWRDMLREKPEKAMKALSRSDAMAFTMAGWNHFLEVIRPQTIGLNDQIEKLQATYVVALQEVFPEKRIYPDANSTLRIAYGNVEGYEPMDAVQYAPQTYLSGVIAKYVPGDYEFDLPAKLIDLYEDKDYGPYAEGDQMPVCFVASNHTTGGNSGSPALNGRGELIGLNFDRAWEGTMSDYNYDISRCRNIMVDIRYVLFIVDKFAGAGYLVDEMDLVVIDKTFEPAHDPMEKQEALAN
jgi:hypothetical protein